MRLGQSGTSSTSGEMELFPMIYAPESHTVKNVVIQMLCYVVQCNVLYKGRHVHAKRRYFQ